jgi:hypothetical protein
MARTKKTAYKSTGGCAPQRVVHEEPEPVQSRPPLETLATLLAAPAPIAPAAALIAPPVAAPGAPTPAGARVWARHRTPRT